MPLDWKSPPFALKAHPVMNTVPATLYTKPPAPMESLKITAVWKTQPVISTVLFIRVVSSDCCWLSQCKTLLPFFIPTQMKLTISSQDQDLIPHKIRLAPHDPGLGRVEEAARDPDRAPLGKHAPAQEQRGDARVAADAYVGPHGRRVDRHAAARNGEGAAALHVGDGPLHDDEFAWDDGAALACASVRGVGDLVVESYGLLGSLR